MVVKFASPPNTIKSNANISMKYFTYLDVGEFVDIPTLSGTIDLTYDGTFTAG